MKDILSRGREEKRKRISVTGNLDYFKGKGGEEEGEGPWGRGMNSNTV